MILCVWPLWNKPVKPFLPHIALTKAGVVLGHVVAQRSPMPVVQYSFPVWPPPPIINNLYLSTSSLPHHFVRNSCCQELTHRWDASPGDWGLSPLVSPVNWVADNQRPLSNLWLSVPDCNVMPAMRNWFTFQACPVSPWAYWYRTQDTMACAGLTLFGAGLAELI